MLLGPHRKRENRFENSSIAAYCCDCGGSVSVSKRDRVSVIIGTEGLVGGANVLRICRARHLVGHRVHLQRNPPTIVPRRVDPGFHEDAPKATFDDLLLDELHAFVALPEESIGREDQQDLGGLCGQELADRIKSWTPFFATSNGNIEVHEIARNEDSKLYRAFKNAANLIDNAMLKFGGIPCVRDAD